VDTLLGVQQILLERGELPPLFVLLRKKDLEAFCKKRLSKFFSIKNWVEKCEKTSSFSNEYYLVIKAVHLGILHLLSGLLFKAVKEDAFSVRTRLNIEHFHLRSHLKFGPISCHKGVYLIVCLGSVGCKRYSDCCGLNNSIIGDLLHNYYLCQIG